MLLVFIYAWFALGIGCVAHNLSVFKRETVPLAIAFILVLPALYIIVVYTFRRYPGGWV
ncbi:hypothetical protein D3C75_882100 [compost metagenome]